MKILAAGTSVIATFLALTVAWNGPAPHFAPDLPARTASTIIALSPEEIAKASQTIDQLIDADLQRSSVPANAAASDETFLRRAFLTIIGRIPTADEALAFLNSTKNNTCRLEE